MKYHDLVEAGREVGYRTELITIEVGSWGMLCANNFPLLVLIVFFNVFLTFVCT